MMIRDRVPNTNDANTRYQTLNKMVGREREKTNYTNVARLALGSVAVAARSVPSAGEITNELKSKRRCTRRAYKEEKKKTKSSGQVQFKPTFLSRSRIRVVVSWLYWPFAYRWDEMSGRNNNNNNNNLLVCYCSFLYSASITRIVHRVMHENKTRGGHNSWPAAAASSVVPYCYKLQVYCNHVERRRRRRHHCVSVLLKLAYSIVAPLLLRAPCFAWLCFAGCLPFWSNEQFCWFNFNKTHVLLSVFHSGRRHSRI